jgi:hypothetical protein
VDGGQRFEGEDGRRGFLDVPAPASAGMLAVEARAAGCRSTGSTVRENGGPSGCGSSRPCWRRTFRRAVRTLGQDPAQVLVVGGPAGDEELLGVLAARCRTAWPSAAATSGGTCPGGPLGHRYAVALGLALAGTVRRRGRGPLCWPRWRGDSARSACAAAATSSGDSTIVKSAPSIPR